MSRLRLRAASGNRAAGQRRSQLRTAPLSVVLRLLAAASAGGIRRSCKARSGAGPPVGSPPELPSPKIIICCSSIERGVLYQELAPKQVGSRTPNSRVCLCERFFRHTAAQSARHRRTIEVLALRGRRSRIPAWDLKPLSPIRGAGNRAELWRPNKSPTIVRALAELWRPNKSPDEIMQRTVEWLGQLI